MTESLRFKNTQVCATERQHNGPITGLAVAGVRLLTGGLDGRILAFERLPKGPFNFAGPELRASAPIVDLHPVRGKDASKSIVVAACRDTEIRVWDTTRETMDRNAPAKVSEVITEEGAHILRGHREKVSGIDVQKTFVLSASEDSTARMWDLNVQKEVVMIPHPGRVSRALFFPGTTQLATQCSDQLVRIWDLRAHTDRPTAVLEAHLGREYKTCAVSEHGHLAVANESGEAHVYDIARTGVTRVLTSFHAPSGSKDHCPPITVMKFVLGARYLACAQADGNILAAHLDSSTAKAFQVQSGAATKQPITVLHSSTWHKKVMLAFAYDQHGWGFGLLENTHDRKVAAEAAAIEAVEGDAGESEVLCL